MHFASLWQIVDWGSLPILVVVLALLIWRRALSEYPSFGWYIVAGELIGLARLWFYSPTGLVYFYFYWATDALIAVLALLATYEIFAKRSFPRFYAVRFYRFLFPTVAVIIASLASVAAIQLNRVRIVIKIIHFLDVVRVTLLLFFVGLMTIMGRRWGRYVFGIALGLGIQASAVLVTSAIWVRNLLVRTADRLPVVAYDVACIIWLITFLYPEKFTPIVSAPVSPGILDQARKWEKTLKESVTGKKRPL